MIQIVKYHDFSFWSFLLNHFEVKDTIYKMSDFCLDNLNQLSKAKYNKMTKVIGGWPQGRFRGQNKG